MNIFERILEILMALMAVVWFLVAIFAISDSHYDQATTYLLMVVVFTMWENQIIAKRRAGDED